MTTSASTTYEQRVKHMAANPYFALARAAQPKVVCVLAKRTDAEGRFECTNGRWNGRFIEGEMHFDGPVKHEPVAMVLVWEGEWPAGCGGYNSAMEWITRTIA